MIYFSNPGLLSIRAATTMGVSVKEGDNPIGMFGTGLKYTIAGVLRLGGKIKIIVGDGEYNFSVIDEVIRDKTFHIVTMNGVPLGFTTEYGKGWEPWMYIRELWSNCMDEGGTHGWSPQPGDTHIIIDCKPLEDAYADRGKFFLEHDEHTLACSDAGDVLSRVSGQNAFFYRGIRVGVIPERMLYNYNIKRQLVLTEDRTAAHMWNINTAVSEIVAQLQDRTIIRHILTAPEGTFENRNLEARAKTSLEFLEVLKDLFINSPQRLNDSYRRFAKNAWGDNSIKSKAPTELEQKKIARALTVLGAIGLTKPVEIKICADETQHEYGFVYNRVVYLTQKCLDEGIGQISTTLIEEYLHATEGLADYSRALQDRMLNIIMKIAEEHVLKEPV